MVYLDNSAHLKWGILECPSQLSKYIIIDTTVKSQNLSFDPYSPHLWQKFTPQEQVLMITTS